MPSFPAFAAVFLPVALLAAVGLVPCEAAAQDSGRSCSGTLCDLYYGSSSSNDAGEPPAGKQTAPTPLMVPNGGVLGRLFSGGEPSQAGASGPATTRPLIGVQGGGLAAMARGAPPERCSVTLCDLCDVRPPPEPAAQPTAPPDQQAPEAAADADPDVAPEPARRRRANDTADRQERQLCASPAADPWKCYR